MTASRVHAIGVLGSGRVGSVLAGRLAEAGHQVEVGTRENLRTVVERAEIVINATPGETTLELMTSLREPLAGKLLVDVANATVRDSDGLPGALAYPDRSLAEHLQDALPDTQVVKTLNTMLFSVMVNPAGLSVPPTAFLSGNDPAAKTVVAGLLGDLGWPTEQIMDLGDVRTARGTEAFVLLVPHFIRSRGLSPFALTIAS